MKQAKILFGLTLAGLTILGGVDGETGEPVAREGFMVARGEFDVKVTQQPQDDDTAGPFGRLFLAKQFHGDLEGAGRGQMLGAFTAVEGSGGYVALEQVTGSLGGRRGSFILQHKGTMKNGVYAMDVTVVPDSGTGELAGIAGTMKISIEGSRHSYEFGYTLASE